MVAVRFCMMAAGEAQVPCVQQYLQEILLQCMCCPWHVL